MDPHWRKQTLLCGLRFRNVGPRLTVLRMEDKVGYLEYLAKVVPRQTWEDGWGEGKNMSFRQHVLSSYEAKFTGN